VSAKHWRRQNLSLTKYMRRQKLLASTKILASKKYWRRQNPGVDKILAFTKSWRQQKAGADKMMVQMQKNPLTVWHGRVHSCWLLPDLAEDLLCLPDGVTLFVCSRQVWGCLQLPCFYGRTLSVPAYCTGPPCWKCHKFWRWQNIGLCLKNSLIFAKL
jgi:hypothetical protein